jgi:hypothetical protein
MVNLGKTIHSFRRRPGDDRGGIRAFISLDRRRLEDFLAGVERIKEVDKLISKGGSIRPMSKLKD